MMAPIASGPFQETWMKSERQPDGNGPEWVIETEGPHKVYRMGRSEVHTIRSVNLRVAAGEFVALMGPSGGGKSTLMHLLGCLDTPTEGTFRLEGRNVSRLSGSERARIRNSRIGFVFQIFNLLPQLTAVENVALPLLYQSRARDIGKRADEALGRVGLAGRARHRPTELSGGERQRVAIARALVSDPAIILADEPTGNLDSATGDDILSMLSHLHRSGRTIMVVTHDAQVASHAQRTLHMRDGRILNGETGDVPA
jgi:putative ABC transport system ATP-binding protein